MNSPPPSRRIEAGLLERRIYPALIAAILTAHPHLTLEHFDQQVAWLAERGRYEQPVFVTAKILARGGTIAPPVRVEPLPPDAVIRMATHVSDAVRDHWLALCDRYPYDRDAIIRDFLNTYPVSGEVA